jgi:hypothetical protein
LALKGFDLKILVKTPLVKINSMYRTIKSLEAEERLGFIADISVLFGGKESKNHLRDLVNRASNKTPKKPRLQETKNGAYVPNVSYSVE